MVLVKGDLVVFRTDENTLIRPNARYGIVHDPEGNELNRCQIFVAPYKLRRSTPKMTKAATRYFGPDFHPQLARVDIPKSGWNPVANVVEIYYRRPVGSGARRGAHHVGKYHHPFHGKPVRLSKSGRCYMLDLPDGCIVDDRGFKWP